MPGLSARRRCWPCERKTFRGSASTDGRGSRSAGPTRGRWLRRLALSLPLTMAVTTLAVAAGAPPAPAVPRRPAAVQDLDATVAGAARIPGPPVEKAGASGLRHWLSERVNALEEALADSGLDVAALIERMDQELSSGQGGPLVPALGTEPARSAEDETVGEELERLERVHRLLEAVPLAAPMETYRPTSGFGYRRDPFTRRGALHEGQDFGGPRNAPVLATAPGTVVEARRSGAYGLLVEIDHGMGIRTRYAHLKKVSVRKGQKVGVRDRVGIMGSTGRSTGAHLHYEIRVDGRALDPKSFLKAGDQLQQLIGG
jgi:murein DD-endopeptidase MepM/ murein hydrolase activator NlpD